jgi:hypothetical protein
LAGKTLMMVDKAIREAVQFRINTKLEIFENFMHEYAINFDIPDKTL